MIKSNLRYPGGKSRLMKYIDPYFPSKIDRYLEIFVGGGSVLLHVIQKYNPSEIIANDIDSELINYYRVVQNEEVNKQLIELILEQKGNHSDESFSAVFNALRDNDFYSPLYRAMKYFVINKNGFNGLRRSTFSKQAFERNFKDSNIKRLKAIGNVITRVNFQNVDFRKIDLNNIKGFFIYLDPPYHDNSAEGLYGKDGKYHSEFDHETFVEFVKILAENNKVMVSYDNCEWVREKFKDFNQYTFDVAYSMTNHNNTKKAKIGKEIIITNYDTEKTLF